jgi:hypothetical protein
MIKASKNTKNTTVASVFRNFKDRKLYKPLHQMIFCVLFVDVRHKFTQMMKARSFMLLLLGVLTLLPAQTVYRPQILVEKISTLYK